MAHKGQNQKQRKIQFQTPKIIKITVWVVIGLLTVLIVGSQVVLWWNKRSAMAKADIITTAAQPVVVEKTCPEDPSKCPSCEGAKNVYIAPSKQEEIGFAEIEITALPGCWSGYVTIIREKNVCAESFPKGTVFRQLGDRLPGLQGPADMPDTRNEYVREGIRWRFMATGDNPVPIKIRTATRTKRLYQNL